MFETDRITAKDSLDRFIELIKHRAAPGRLLNCKQIAAEMGRAPTYISAMKAAGYKMKYPGRDVMENVLAWLEAHPDFKSTEYFRRSGVSGLQKRRQHRARSTGRRNHRAA